MRMVLVLAAIVLGAGAARADELRDIYQELIEIDTTHDAGSTTKAAEAMAARLKGAGLPAADVQVLVPPGKPTKGNLVARLRGTGKRKPLLLLAHIDVVDAHKEDWTTDPFKLVEKDGFYYARGSSDDKAMAAIWVELIMRLARAGARPDRDLVVALTADEESGPDNGVSWLLATHRDLIDAAYALNEGGGGEIKDGKYIANEVQVSEKTYQSFQLETTNPGGHSSRPSKDNAIYHLAAALDRLARFDFPAKLDDGTRAMLLALSRIPGMKDARDLTAAAKGLDARLAARLSKDSYYNALLRTTCVATQVAAGHAENALPQRARATVNCRLLPGEDVAAVQKVLAGVVADPAIAVTPLAPGSGSPGSALLPELMGAVGDLTQAMWPGIVVMPSMSTGATDGRYLRAAGIPCYGVSGIFRDVDDVRAHGKDERLGVKQLGEGRTFLYRLVRRLSGLPDEA
jgi:acetylornithine deacetylase/succinyl-diaminopimelate desuccinylase-like protein